MRISNVGLIACSVVISCAAAAAGCSTTTSVPAPPPTGADGTSPSNGRLSLRQGEVAELTVTDGLAGIKLAPQDESEEYVLVLASTKFDTSGTSAAWSVSTEGAPEDASASIVTGCSVSPEAWQNVKVSPETAPTGTAVAKGTKTKIQMPTASGYEEIEVEAVAVGKHAVVWKDITAAHPASLEEDFISPFLTDFDDLILPRERAIFGVESDIDGDGHIALVFSPLTRETAVAFFSGCDLTKKIGCSGSNAGEYLYLTPPNAIDPPYNTPNAIKEILAHELAHLVHYNRKVLRNEGKAASDSGYMNEGLGAFAQDAIGPQSGNLYVTKAGLEKIAEFSLGDVFVDGTPYDMKRDGVMRGGAYLFVRWLYDRAGGDVANADGTIDGKGGPAFLRALLEAPESVSGALPSKASSSLASIGVDFYTALAMSGRDAVGGAAPTNPCFSYLPAVPDPVTGKPRGADVFAQFHGTRMTGPATTKKTSGKLLSGGVTYVTVPAPEDVRELDIGVTIDPTLRPHVRIGRVR